MRLTSAQNHLISAPKIKRLEAKLDCRQIAWLVWLRATNCLNLGDLYKDFLQNALRPILYNDYPLKPSLAW